jgi:hypothetical protein
MNTRFCLASYLHQNDILYYEKVLELTSRNIPELSILLLKNLKVSYPNCPT